MMGFFVNNWIFGDASIEEVIKRVTRIGFDGIELVGEPKLYKANYVKSLLEAHGLKVCSICGMFPGPDESDLRAACHPDPSERQKALDYIKSCIDLAAEVGARSVLVVPSLVGQPAYFRSKEEDLEVSKEVMVKAAEYAKETGILLTLEPINRYEVGLINSLDEAIEYCKDINNEYFRTMGDTFHMQIEEPDGIPNAIRRAGKYWFQHLHVADNTRRAPGMGTIPWREIIRALYDIEYEGAVSCEPLPKGASPYEARKGKIPAEKLDEELEKGLTFLKHEKEIVLELLNG
ncbi:MAG: hypothetical protein PWQ20_337 [Thermotogaceae bacterium]|jgi:sugar phosphate isomerase/epimerase|nr:hypothetical protein [Thermotogaceae bacterium]MDN5337267.1 hypothetical protein [Thermotogaceae bacterium]